MRSSIRIVVIAGIRAQFMKLAAFQDAVSRWNAISTPRFEAIYINSGQHYDDDLAGVFIQELGIRFDIDLTGTYGDLRPIRLLAEMIVHLHEALLDRIDLPDWVIVFGDANTTLAGSLAAAKLGLPVIHIEAGLRTGDFSSPEEVNRVVSDHLSRLHFVSSRRDMDNLAKEGLIETSFWTGDLIGDLVARLSSTIAPSLDGFQSGTYILASIHREENVRSDKILRNIIQSLNSFGRPVVFIAHPRVRERLKQLRLFELENIRYVNALPYKSMLSAIKGCAYIFTDSGAFQREAYYLRKRCIIRQDQPFWSALVNSGVHITVGTSPNSIFDGLKWAEKIILEGNYPVVGDLGDGSAGNKILHYIAQMTEL